MSLSSARSPWLVRGRLVLTCVSIAANAILAGGVFTFPILAPALASHLKLTQPQLTTIVLAGMIGQYPFAVLVGKIIDKIGPWASSLASAVLFSLGFGLFAQEIAKTPDDITRPSTTSFHHLAMFFFMAGLGTVFSYFSSLLAASKNFPNYIGIASGTSMGIFGLSPLFLSVMASNYFTSEESGLNVTRFLRFLAITAGAAHLTGAIVLRTPEPSELVPEPPSPPDDDESENFERHERSPLLPGKPVSDVEVQVIPVPDNSGSALDLLRDPYFWVLAITSLLILSSCEMVISNIGTIVLSLPSSRTTSNETIVTTGVPPVEVATATQVRVLSLSNTVSRLLAGPLADFVSPVASYLPSGIRTYPRKHHISRMAFVSGSAFVLAITFFTTTFAVRSQGDVFPLSIGIGIVYGTTFTILPSIVSSIWGLPNLGRNYGILAYAPFIGTPLFSYLYAFVSAGHTDGGAGVCMGVDCWASTFWVSSAASVVALASSVALWKVWKGRV